MLAVKINHRVKGYCDWCAKPVTRTLNTITLVTERGTDCVHLPTRIRAGIRARVAKTDH